MDGVIKESGLDESELILVLALSQGLGADIINGNKLIILSL